MEFGATCLGYRVQEWLQDGPHDARVHGVYASACNLQSTDGGLVTLTLQSRAAPLTINTPGMRAGLDRLSRGERVRLDPSSVFFPDSTVHIDLTAARVWPGLQVPAEPLALPVQRLAHLCTASDCSAGCRASGFLAPMLPRLVADLAATGGQMLPSRKGALDDRLASEAFSAISQLCEALGQRAEDNVVAQARRLVGLGPGLTPSGDDFLTGYLLTLDYGYRGGVRNLAWVPPLAAAIARFATGRTSLVAEHQLRLAACGEADEVTGEAAVAMLWGADRMEASLNALLCVGSSSGGDILTGICLASALIST